jgi:hypothetical protein
MSDTIQGLIFACACFVALCLILWAIAAYNDAIPWPEMDNPQTQEKTCI